MAVAVVYILEFKGFFEESVMLYMWDKPGASPAAVSGLSQNVMGGREDERSERREAKRNMDSWSIHLYVTQTLRPAHC